jgi:putative oxidoreductase
MQNFFLRPSADQKTSTVLLMLRVVAGSAFMHHGFSKIHNPFGWMGPTSTIPGFLQALAALSEFGGGFAWIIGLVVPLASLGILSTMIVAVSKHLSRGDPFVGKGAAYELALVYGCVAVLLFVVGPGRFSVDALLWGRERRKRELSTSSVKS